MTEKFPIINSKLSPNRLAKFIQQKYGLSERQLMSNRNFTMVINGHRLISVFQSGFFAGVCGRNSVCTTMVNLIRYNK